MVRLLSKTHKVKGPNGRRKIVYKDIDDAFPLYIKGWKASLDAAVEVLDKAKVDIKTEYATAIHGLLFSLDELNNELMMKFRVVYIYYQSDPFENSSFFERSIGKILDEHGRLKAHSLKINGLIGLAKLQPDNSDEFIRVYANIIDSIDSIMVPTVASQRIAEAKQITKKIAEDKHED